jgi:hypothetical protein
VEAGVIRDITLELENMAGFDRNPVSGDETVAGNRIWCKTCGGHLYTDHPTMGLVDVPAVIIVQFEFTPAFHVHYQETVQSMKDSLPKFKDLPKAAGGSGAELHE